MLKVLIGLHILWFIQSLMKTSLANFKIDFNSTNSIASRLIQVNFTNNVDVFNLWKKWTKIDCRINFLKHYSKCGVMISAILILIK